MSRRARRTGGAGDGPAREPDAAELLAEADLALAEGDVRKARECLGGALRVDPSSSEAWVLLAEVDWALGELGEAERGFAAALRRLEGPRADVPLRTRALAGLARTLRDAGRPDAARGALAEALAADPPGGDALRLEAAELDIALGRPEEALGALAGVRDPDPAVSFDRALACFLTGRIREAAADLRCGALENVFFEAALRGDPMPDEGIVFGREEASPDHAAAYAERMGPTWHAAPGATGFLRRILGAAAALDDRRRLLDLARRLNGEPRPGPRAELLRALGDLRDPHRIASTLPIMEV